MTVKNGNGREFRKVRDVSSDGKPGGALVWLLWVLQLTLKISVNETQPSAIASNIASQATITTPGEKIENLPGESYIRK